MCEKGCTRGLDYAKEDRKVLHSVADRTYPELFCGGGSLMWHYSTERTSLPSAPRLKCSRQSLRGSQHPFGSSGVMTLYRSFVVVQSKCIAGCLCYWNTVDCFKWLPLMPVFFSPPSLFVTTATTHKEQWFHMMYAFPPLFCTRKRENELQPWWHFLKYHCDYFWLRCRILHIEIFPCVSWKAQRPVISFMSLRDNNVE